MEIGALGFWIFIAAVVVAGIWAKSRREAEKHETIRRILEKTGTLDEEKLKALFKTESPAPQKPGDGYRFTRVMGTIILFIAAAVLTFVVLVGGVMLVIGGLTGPFRDGSWILGIAIPAVIAIFGYGLFYSSRFCEPPLPARNDPPAP